MVSLQCCCVCSLTLCPDELLDIGLEEESLPSWLKMMISFRNVPLSDYGKGCALY